MPAVISFEHVSVGIFNQSLRDLATGMLHKNKLAVQIAIADGFEICSFAFHNGLPDSALDVLLGILTVPNCIDQSNIAILIKNLYPAERVHSRHICTVTHSLGQGRQKPSLSTQHLLIKWLIMVHDFLEDETILGRLYHIFFNLLDVLSIRTNLCQILAITTRRKHVRPFRIQALLELSTVSGNDPAVVALLKVYKDYHPDVVIDQSIARRTLIFECLDPKWQDRLRVSQDTVQQTFSANQRRVSSFNVTRKHPAGIGETVVSKTHTHRAGESSVTLEDIDGLHDFVDKFDRIELPNQAASTLDDSLMQNFMVLVEDKSFQERIDSRLSLLFDYQLHSVQFAVPKTPLIEVLPKILSYTAFTKVLLTSLDSFLAEYLAQWDGKEHRDLLLELLTYLPLQHFGKLHTRFFVNIENATLSDTLGGGAALLDFYTELLRKWTTRLLATSQAELPDITILNTTFTALSTHASLLSLSLLVSYPPTQCNICAVFDYHEMLAHAISHAPTYPQIRILTPHQHTIYLLIFQFTNLSSLSRLCSVVATYKLAFESTMAKPPPRSRNDYPKDYVNQFNGFLMDICNLVWRSRAFNASDTNALGCFLPSPVISTLRTYVEMLTPPRLLITLFSLSYNSVLCTLSIAAFRELEDEAIRAGEPLSIRHAGPPTQRSLAALSVVGGLRVDWADYRLEALEWLDRGGVGGIRELMFRTMKHLMNNRGAGEHDKKGTQLF